jgi:glycerophosphoryl diester phosphodiesterase
MNQLDPARPSLRTLSPVVAPRPSRPAPTALDRFEQQAERQDTASGPNWPAFSLATMGVLATTAGAVQAQIQAPQPPLPDWLGSRDRQVDTEPPLVVAHRGSTENAVENTLEAFRDALADGADAIELDVHLTLDRDLVVMHDDTLERTYGLPGEVRKMTSAELRELGVPMLSDALALPNQGKWIVEIKHPKGGRHQGIEQVVVDQLHRAGVQDQAIVISFDEISLKKLEQIEPDLPTGYLYSGRPIDPKQVKEELGIDFLGPHFGLVTEGYVRKAHEAGLKVNPWTVNTPRDQKRMIALDVDAMTTDQARQLVELIQSNP